MILQATPNNRASELALKVYSEVLDAVRADRMVRTWVERIGDELFIQGQHIDLSHFDHVWIAGAGKAAVEMAKAAVPAMAAAIRVILNCMDFSHPTANTGPPELDQR